MASVAESLFADDARGRRKKKKRGASSKQIDAVLPSGSGDGAAFGDWQPFTSPDGRTYYYNQVTHESRWKLPRALREKQAHAGTPTSHAKDDGTDEPTTSTAKVVDEAARPKQPAKKKEDKPISARGDIVARLQASLAGRINPMGGAGGPPPMIQIPRGIPEATSSGGGAARAPAETNGDGIFSESSGGFGGETPEAEFDAETAGMTPAERLRFIRRKRQESMFKKEKIVEEDDFMKEFAMNMKKKEAERVQRMTPEDLEREQREKERKQREAEAKKKRDEDAQRKKREAQEEEERERQQQREEEQRRWREEEKKATAEKEREAQRIREEEERVVRERKEQEKKKRQQEKEAERQREMEEETRRKAEQEERAQRRVSDASDQRELVRQRSRTTSSGSAVSGSFWLFGEESGGDAGDAESRETKARRRTRSTGSKTFAAEAVVYSETHRSRPSSRRSLKEEEQEDVQSVEANTPPTSTSESPPLEENASASVDAIAESLEVVHFETHEETSEERAARKERRRKKKERRRLEEAAEAAAEDELAHSAPPPSSSSSSSTNTPVHCQCAACIHQASTGHMPPPQSSFPHHHHHQPPAVNQYPHGSSYPYYPPGYPPPPPFYPPPPPMYGYPPPPFMPMYPPPPLPQMMFPPGMVQMPMMMAPPLSGGAMVMMSNGATSNELIATSPYAQYLPPVLSQCESCRGRGVGLAEKNGLCAHCNRLRLDFIVASAQIKRRCATCGGWGLGLVQSDGRCAHCTRVAASSSKTTATTATTAQVDWDASSSDGDSDWDE